MFTGLVQAVGLVRSVSGSRAGRRILVDTGRWGHRPAPGDSISVSGCCLTVAAKPRSGRLAFDVIPQTLSLTTLGMLKPGSRVNLEHSVTPTTLMGGHFVQGHVDGAGRVTRVSKDGGWRVRVGPPANLMPFLTPQGSVCIDGVSLTIAAVHRANVEIDVALIPTTLKHTTLGALAEGDAVNIEADVLAKLVFQFLTNSRSIRTTSRR